jgi:hypothetical protein
MLTSLAVPALLAALAAPSESPLAKADVFDMPGRQVIQDEGQLGIANGRTTIGVNYRDVAGISGLWAPPYVGSNFTLDVRVRGEKVNTVDWTWRPYQVLRSGTAGDVKVSSVTTLPYGHRAVILEFRFSNGGSAAASLDLLTLSWLDSVRDWGFGRAGSGSQTALEVDGRRLVMRQGKLAIVVAMDSPAWKWEASGNLGHAAAEVAAGQTLTTHVVITIGADAEAPAEASKLIGSPAGAVTAAGNAYARRLAEMADRLPALESGNRDLVRWYNRSLVHFVTNRWDVPEFALNPYYSTGSVLGGCVCNYLWNFGEVWEILPLYDPAAARTHIKKFLEADLFKHFFFYPITGKADGLWYMVNQEKIIGLTYYYVMLTGDAKFLADLVDGKPIVDHMVRHAMYGDDTARPPVLIDYGDSNSHLELRRGYPYNHVMPDLNGRRYVNYLRAADLCDLAGKPAPYLRERAELLKPLLKSRLWDANSRWFRFEDGKGKGDLRYTVQMFKMIGGGVLDRECEEGLVGHLNEKEFLSAYGLHSLSKRDPAYDQIDIDNGGGGICTSFPTQIIERLYQANRPELAADMLARLLWWGESMPYWGDSITANCRDYRRDTPLQCTLDGVAGAQCVIFGVFGVKVRPGGEIVFKPQRLPFAPEVALKGLRLLGRTADVRVSGGEYEVRAAGRSIRAAAGSPVTLAADGTLRAGE